MDSDECIKDDDGICIPQGGSKIESFSQIENIDLTFGLKDELPGLKYLLTIEGPFEFIRGFFKGIKVTQDKDADMCDKLIGDELVANILQV
jgi:hypothetical protein